MDFMDNTLTIENLVKNNILPRYIYKYYTDKENRLQETLNNQTIWFSMPMDFNDPFDCRLRVNANSIEKDINVFAEHLFDSRIVSDVEKLKLRRILHNPKDRQMIANESIMYNVAKSGVSCFSKNRDSILMWSHYSNKHKGYCLKFDVLKDPKFFIIPVIVDYKTKYPNIDFFRNYNKNRNALFAYIFGKKFSDWSYEEEIRIVKHAQGNVRINPESIVEISFGVNCIDDNIELIKNLCQINNYKHINFEKAKRKERDFQVKFNKT